MRRHALMIRAFAQNRALGAMLISLATTGGLAISTMPAAAVEQSQIEGRWKETTSVLLRPGARSLPRSEPAGPPRKNLILDISQCGNQYCGRIVTADNQCGNLVLRIELKKNLDFEGQLYLPERPIFKASVGLLERTGQLSITGDDSNGPEFAFWRRTFPFEALLDRDGEAVCRQPTS